MSKAFTKETEQDDEELPELSALPAGTRNYMTPGGYAVMRAEFKQLVEVERPHVTQVVSWAAGNGDRSENGDYIYGKKRLREIDRRMRYLLKRLDNAEVVDPASRPPTDQVFFGATVTVCDVDDVEETYQIVGIDEADVTRGRISWISPLARALFKAREGDSVRFPSPAGVRELDIVSVRYLADEPRLPE